MAPQTTKENGSTSNPNSSSNGAEVLVRALHDAGVRTIFANPGTTEMHIVGAMDTATLDPSAFRSVLCLHETVCTGAADGYGRMARKPAATLLHLGVGLANGLANLHNARRARSPIINVVGEMSTWLKHHDPVLNTDIEAMARTVCEADAVRTVKRSEDLAKSAHDAVAACLSPGEPRRSRVATLVVPHDLAYEEDVAVRQAQPAPARGPPDDVGAAAFIKACAKALRACPRGKAALLVGGAATLSDDGALARVGRIAAAVGASLFCENNFARLDRGVGLPVPRRLSYFPEDAMRELKAYDTIVCIDCRRPVAMFGYAKGPAALLPEPGAQGAPPAAGEGEEDDRVWELDASGHVGDALRMLEAEVGAARVTPGTNCGGLFVCEERRPAMPNADAKLTAAALCAVVARRQPAGCVVVDESLTSGTCYFDYSKACPPFHHLTLTGGAIGCGPPLAVGAALGAPDAPAVITLQADGSGLYSVQALYTQAREGLHVITVVCKNARYNILNLELAKQRVPSKTQGLGKGKGQGASHTARMTDIAGVDWCGLAPALGVPATQATTAGELDAQLVEALARDGPSLIECVLP